ncbi:MAG: DUF4384 domain-containing protein [Candidatus Eisenbacteria bacterium]|nr:DUF4384 domain-containing protein [Candidatus Eisenbacteria bacterium]
MGRLLSMWKLPTLTAVALASAVAVAAGATVVEEDSGSAQPERVEGAPAAQRIVPTPEPWWPDARDWRDWDQSDAPRIRVWVDRGEWATYEPGDRIAVYFRVDRPCYVTILSYTTTGDVEVLFPSAWTGSGFVRSHEVHRIPDSRRYSLRVAGPPGVETIVAYAHDGAWPTGWATPWAFRASASFHPRAAGGRDVGRGPGAVIIDPPGPQGRGRGRVVVEPRWWPAPPGWADAPSRWSYDEVSFYVSSARWDVSPWPRHRGPSLWEQFEMWRCSDEFRREVRARGDAVEVAIRCIESASGRPTTIVGRAVAEDGGDSKTLFRLDASGRRGDAPERGRAYAAHIEGLRVEIEILDVELSRRERDGSRRIEWIRFDVRASAN